MIIEVILLIVGLILLVKGSGYLIKAAAALAKILNVSEFVIGLSVVALGTSIPELASAVFAAVFKDSGLVIGNIVGSNVANIGLVIGLAASFYYIKTKPAMLKRDGYIMLFASVLFYLFILDYTLNWVDGVILLFFYFVYMTFLFGEKPKDHIGQFIRHFFGFRYLATIRSRVFYYDHKKKVKQKGKVKRLVGKEILKEVLILLLSGVAVVVGANFFIKEAVFFADYFGVASNLVGITLVALGTSLPELVVSITAARKGFGDIAVCNIIGSNIANIFFVGGVAALISPLSIVKSTIYYSVPFMLVMSLILLFFLRNDWRLKQWEGMILVFLYVIFILFLIMGGLY